MREYITKRITGIYKTVRKIFSNLFMFLFIKFEVLIFKNKK